jgi:hypothetical protein
MRLEDLYALGAQLGADTLGVVSASDLRRADADPDTVKAALGSAWQRPLRGVYVTHRRPLDDITRAHVAAKHAGPDCVLTGLVAARWLGLRWVPEGESVQVLIDSSRRRSSCGWVLVRRHRDLHALPSWDRHGLRIAEVPKVVVDAARELGSLRSVRGLVLGAVADRLCTAQELRELLDTGATGGTALARRACLDAERGATSPPEAELVDGLLACAFPIPFYCNVEVRVSGDLLGIADVWLVGSGVGGEMDSRERHGEQASLDSTLRRHSRFADAGVSLRHVTPTRYRADPAAFHRELFDAALARRATGLGDPPGLELVPRGHCCRPPPCAGAGRREEVPASADSG